MNVIKKFTIKPTNTRIVETPLTISKIDSKEPMPGYELQLLLRQMFVADNDTYERAAANAKKQIAFYLYDEVLREIQQALTAVYEGDREKTIAILCELKTDIMDSIR